MTTDMANPIKQTYLIQAFSLCVIAFAGMLALVEGATLIGFINLGVIIVNVVIVGAQFGIRAKLRRLAQP